MRFALLNRQNRIEQQYGTIAVIEGAGDNACEYMTGG
ncbi:hypothetical protein CGH97_17780, partial [Vibrio parahaemolyticus]